MRPARRRSIAIPMLSVLMVFACACSPMTIDADESPGADVIVVGAGLAGLSAAIEAAAGGARVLVVDMNSVFGGHAIQSGGVAIIGTPMQEALGYTDSPELAFADWLNYTEDPNVEWMRYYVSNSRSEIYDFLTSIGVVFDRVVPSHGNSVPRFHMTERRGLNLLRPLFVEALQYPALSFRWNLVVTELLQAQGGIAGVIADDLRTGERVTLRAPSVVLATGGFQRNSEMAHASWPSDLPQPRRLLSGSGKFSLGIGHRIAADAGAALIDMERQYNNVNAIPDPRDASGTLGLGVSNRRAIWVNAAGHRFVNPDALDRDVYRTVLEQPGGTYWAIFDHAGSGEFRVSGADWADRPLVAAQILQDDSLVVTAPTLEALAARIQIPRSALVETVERFNTLVEHGTDEDFGTFAPDDPIRPMRIATPPFYAVQLYPMAHKNMGGVAIDIDARVLDLAQRPVPGLFAAGEITGSAGINGRAGLDGTFTGPAILIGRVAGRSAAQYVTDQHLLTGPADPDMRRVPLHLQSHAEIAAALPAMMTAAELDERLAQSRDGFWHFEKVHSSTQQRRQSCLLCHSDIVPTQPVVTRMGLRAQANSCHHCHQGPQIR